MSRVGKKLITIPENVEVKFEGGSLSVNGPLGEIKRAFRDEINIDVKDGIVTLNPKKETPFLNALWGTYSSHISNMIKGVTAGFEKKLVIEGVGYKSELQGEDLVLSLGFSHPIKMKSPEGVKISVEKNAITISGIDKEMVGQTAAKIREFKKPEPYKGKGIRYEGEVIRRKAGKKAVTAG